ncbi:hypothetical protein FB45DRAFT_302053 [Roridomyces roridus]|uniref:Uncharacterized protein n=1 Tax=Roridomyces roridus TaxID=1738132 RepID=A0AAD7B737_9AGAR|nr:hypothetical protein FB45DRAFT_302053 [Roridomyces roridus]
MPLPKVPEKSGSTRPKSTRGTSQQRNRGNLNRTGKMTDADLDEKVSAPHTLADEHSTTVSHRTRSKSTCMHFPVPSEDEMDVDWTVAVADLSPNTSRWSSETLVNAELRATTVTPFQSYYPSKSTTPTPSLGKRKRFVLDHVLVPRLSAIPSYNDPLKDLRERRTYSRKDKRARLGSVSTESAGILRGGTSAALKSESPDVSQEFAATPRRDIFLPPSQLTPPGCDLYDTVEWETGVFDQVDPLPPFLEDDDDSNTSDADDFTPESEIESRCDSILRRLREENCQREVKQQLYDAGIFHLRPSTSSLVEESDEMVILCSEDDELQNPFVPSVEFNTEDNPITDTWPPICSPSDVIASPPTTDAIEPREPVAGLRCRVLKQEASLTMSPHLLQVSRDSHEDVECDMLPPMSPVDVLTHIRPPRNKIPLSAEQMDVDVEMSSVVEDSDSFSVPFLFESPRDDGSRSSLDSSSSGICNDVDINGYSSESPEARCPCAQCTPQPLQRATSRQAQQETHRLFGMGIFSNSRRR